MKIVQIENGFVHWDATQVVPDLDWAAAHYAPNIVFVEAPDFVREGFAYDENNEGDDRFIRPEAPEGWHYDDETGTFIPDCTEDSETNVSASQILAQSIINAV